MILIFLIWMFFIGIVFAILKLIFKFSMTVLYYAIAIGVLIYIAGLLYTQATGTQMPLIGTLTEMFPGVMAAMDNIAAQIKQTFQSAFSS